jgi:ABC-type phosphate/phosphonate transport system permease subunit
MTNTFKSKEQGLIKAIILIIIAIAILSWYGVDIKDFFTSEQFQKNLGYILDFLKDVWSDYLTVPAHKLWEIWLQYVWVPITN